MFRTVVLTLVFVVVGLAPSAQAQVKLEHKFNEGSKTKTQITTKTHQILTINGADVETNAEEVIVASTGMGTRKPDGSLPIEQKIESIRVQLGLPMNKVVSYDSANPPAKKDDDPTIKALVEIYDALVGTIYTVTLDKQNKFVSVEGLQQVLDKANGLSPIAVDALKERLDSDRIKKSFEVEHDNLPPILVRVGDSWERTQESSIGGGQTLTFQKKYEYMGPVDKDGQKLDKVKVTSLTVVYALEQNPAAEVKIKVDKSDLKIASSEGMFLFDRQAGRIVESQSVNRITGDMTLNINGMNFPTKLDLTMDTSSKLQK